MVLDSLHNPLYPSQGKDIPSTHLALTPNFKKIPIYLVIYRNTPLYIMETKFVRVSHEGLTHHVCFYSGVSPSEMNKLIVSLFPSDEPVAGLQDPNGIFISLNTACESPELLVSPYYGLVYDNDEGYGDSSVGEEGYGFEGEEDDMLPMLDFVEVMALENQISTDEVAILNRLIHEGSEEVLNAFEAFDVNDDVLQLKDTLVDLCKEEGRKDNEGQNNINDLNDFITTLLTEKYVSAYEAAILRSLVFESDDEIVEALAKYDQDDDIFNLRDTLVGIARNAVQENEFDYTNEDEEEDEEDDDPDSKIQLFMDFVDLMVSKNQIEDILVPYLRQLIVDLDEEVEQAFTDFESEQDYVALVQKLTFASQKSFASAEFDLQNETADDDSDRIQGFHMFINTLVFGDSPDSLSDSEAEYLHRLVDNMDSRILDAFGYYDEHNDMDILSERLVALAKSASDDAIALQLLRFIQHLASGEASRLPAEEETLLVALARAKNPTVLQAFKDAAERDVPVRELRDSLSTIARTEIFKEAQFTYLCSIIDEMSDSLDEEEAINLQLLVQQQHELISAAWDAFLFDNNVDELKDTLARVARLVRADLSEYRQERGDGRRPEAPTPNQDFLSLIDEWENFEVITADQRDLLETLIHEENEVVMSAFEVFDRDGDERELLDTLLRVISVKMRSAASKNALGGLTSFLKSAFDSGHFGETTYDFLLQLADAGNSWILAGYEAYLIDRDVNDFIDTLTRLANLLKRDSAPSTSSTSPATVDAVSNLIQLLEAREALSAAGAEYLRTRLSNCDDFVLAAYDVFCSSNDYGEFADSLVRYASRATNELDTESNAYREEVVLQAYEAIKSENQGLEQLWKVIECIADEELKNYLVAAYETADEFLMASYDVYKSVGDLDDFMDSLLRYAFKLQEEDSLPPPPSAGDEVNAEEVKERISFLHQGGLLSDYQTSVLLDVIESDQDSAVLYGAFESYRITGDDEDLVETLQLCASSFAEGESPRSKREHAVSASDTDIFTFVTYMRDSNLCAYETCHTIELLAQSNDIGVAGAWKQYLNSRNEEQLISKLVALAESVTKADSALNPLSEFEMLLRIVNEKGLISNATYFAVKTHLQDDDRIRAIYDVFLDNESLEDLVDNLNHVARKLISDNLPAVLHDIQEISLDNIHQFISMMVKNDILPEDVGFCIARLAEVGSSPVLAAFDIFVDQQDLEDFRDTLLTIYSKSLGKEESEEEEVEEEEGEPIDIMYMGSLPSNVDHVMPLNSSKTFVQHPYFGESNSEEESDDGKGEEIALQYFSKNNTKAGEGVDSSSDEEEYGESMNIQYLSSGKNERTVSFANESSSEEEYNDDNGTEIPIAYYQAVDSALSQTKKEETEFRAPASASAPQAASKGGHSKNYSVGAIPMDIVQHILKGDAFQDSKEIIMDMIRNQDPLIIAAFETYCNDGNFTLEKYNKLTDFIQKIVERL
jgi:hypothetical protein